MKIIAVVVTYNRLALLKKCISAIQNQTRKPDEIIVINNSSTDGTKEWLETQQLIVIEKPNAGAAGGFALGIKTAYIHQANWVWVMDDDAIPTPNALEELSATLDRLANNRQHVGFLASKVLWKDGQTHEMNKTYKLIDQAKLSKLTLPDKNSWPLVQFSTFVSMLISSEALKKVGLPFKDFFIWCDDVEFSKRMISSGFAGILVENSVVVHESETNNPSNVFYDPKSSIWKFNHGLRNEMYTKRMHEGSFSFWKTWIHRMLVLPFRVALARKNDRWPFMKLVWRTTWKATFFKPVIEHV